MIANLLVATIALVGGTLWTASGDRIEGSTVIIEGNRVIRIGKDIPIPTGAVVKDCHGRVITSGFIDAYTQLGLVEISGVRSSNDTRPSDPRPMRPQLKSTDALNPNSFVLAQQVEYGLLEAGIHLSGGLISGQMAVIELTSGRPHKHFVGLNVRLGGDSEQSRAKYIADLNDGFEQARAWNEKESISDRPEQLSGTQMRVLKRLMKGEGRLFVEAHRQSDIETALALGQRFGVRIVIVGAQEGWRVADALAASQTPVIINPVQNMPSSFDRIHLNPKHISILLDAGVEVAISTFSSHQARKLRQWVGNAIRDGMPYPDAVRSVTQTPAKILGLPQPQGPTAGAIANLVVWSGDPFELSSFPIQRISQGVLIEPKTRQQKLLQRYRCLNPDADSCRATETK